MRWLERNWGLALVFVVGVGFYLVWRKFASAESTANKVSGNITDVTNSNVWKLANTVAGIFNPSPQT
jgi:hypothetical protein